LVENIKKEERRMNTLGRLKKKEEEEEKKTVRTRAVGRMQRKNRWQSARSWKETRKGVNRLLCLTYHTQCVSLSGILNDSS
jgi:hypothetical protein